MFLNIKKKKKWILSVKALIMLKQIKAYPGRSENENEET